MHVGRSGPCWFPSTNTFSDAFAAISCTRGRPRLVALPDVRRELAFLCGGQRPLCAYRKRMLYRVLERVHDKADRRSLMIVLPVALGLSDPSPSALPSPSPSSSHSASTPPSSPSVSSCESAFVTVSITSTDLYLVSVPVSASASTRVVLYRSAGHPGHRHPHTARPPSPRTDEPVKHWKARQRNDHAIVLDIDQSCCRVDSMRSSESP